MRKEEAKRFNEGKARLDLIPDDVVWYIAEILTNGAEKYDERNWEKGVCR